MKNIDKLKSLNAEQLAKVLLVKADIPEYIDTSHISYSEAMAKWLDSEFKDDLDFHKVFHFMLEI